MKVKENQFVKIWEINDDSILYFSYQPDISINIDNAKTIVVDRLDFTNNEDRLLMGYIDGLKNITNEARKFMASEEGTKGIKAGAFVTSNKLSRTICNFFILINKPLKPARLFTSEEAAKKWLLKYK